MGSIPSISQNQKRETEMGRAEIDGILKGSIRELLGTKAQQQKEEEEEEEREINKLKGA
jgi:hypothetical protein